MGQPRLQEQVNHLSSFSLAVYLLYSSGFLFSRWFTQFPCTHGSKWLLPRYIQFMFQFKTMGRSFSVLISQSLFQTQGKESDWNSEFWPRWERAGLLFGVE